jgi:hypothetical protein
VDRGQVAGEGRGGGGFGQGRDGERQGLLPAARPGRPGLGAGLRRGVPGPGRAAARAGEQCRRRPGSRPDQAGFRADVRSQPPGPLRADAVAARAVDRERAGPGGDGVQRLALRGPRDRLRGAAPAGARRHRDARVRRLQAVQRAVLAGTGPPDGGHRGHHLRAAPGRGGLGHLAAGAVAGPPADDAAHAHRRPGRRDVAVLRDLGGGGAGQRAVLRQVRAARAEQGGHARAGRRAVEAQRGVGSAVTGRAGSRRRSGPAGGSSGPGRGDRPG